jgi:hypothetical protein
VEGDTLNQRFHDQPDVGRRPGAIRLIPQAAKGWVER